MDCLALLQYPLVITGDFNMYADRSTDNTVNKFMGLLEVNDLEQLVCGHTLDLLITRNDGTFLKDVTIFLGVSDHHGVHYKLTLPVVRTLKHSNNFRKYKNIDKAEFQSDVIQALALLDANQGLDNLVGEYNCILRIALDKHVPLMTKRILCHPENPWFNENRY